MINPVRVRFSVEHRPFCLIAAFEGHGNLIVAFEGLCSTVKR